VKLGLLAAVLLLAGCGGGTVTTVVTTTAQLPQLPEALAGRLAAETDAVAVALDGGDACAARAAATKLQADTIAAINARQVPPIYEEELLGRVNALTAKITCTPPAPVVAKAPRPAPHGPPGHRKGERHGKKHGHGKKEH
jgi:uncharacterized lipoprotein YajG